MKLGTVVVSVFPVWNKGDSGGDDFYFFINALYNFTMRGTGMTIRHQRRERVIRHGGSIM